MGNRRLITAFRSAGYVLFSATLFCPRSLNRFF